MPEGNRLQQAYARWAAPYYARMSPAVRSEARRVDGWLVSRRSAGLWLGVAAALLATGAGLHAAGLPRWLAALASLAIWGGLLVGTLGAWLQPEKYSGQRLLRGIGVSLLLAYLGLVTGFLFGRVHRHGSLGTDTLAQALVEAVSASTPYVLALMAAMATLMWGVAQIRHQRSERELAALRLVQERDSAARQAAEAQLRLLQAQIQPHFIFNTLATVQHWVDTADPRAAPLLRALSTFLRGSTELLARQQATLAEEAALAGHYLAILQARLGPRLRVAIDIDPGVAGQSLPPGLLLTLVENAVEHGISPALTGGTVRVQAGPTADGWQLGVSDDGAGLAADWREGTGLANCRQRLAHQFGARARLTLSPRPQGTGTLACIEVQQAATAEGQTP